MARLRLPPGFRFHPTDVELIMYYLKRKVMGKNIRSESVISECNIYKFCAWDLPAQSGLNTKDLEWYFFCPRERKYASGERMNRATESGYWKTTGRDRTVCYDDRVVGMVKTLVYHTGHPPQGQRTDWVIHEYRIQDKQLADAGIAQDAYVLCKVFKKSGPGPKNGAQYGAPFKEEDWEDEIDDNPIPSQSLPFGEPTSKIVELPEPQSCSVVTSMLEHPGTTSGLSFGEPGPSSHGPSATDDEINQLLANFVVDEALASGVFEQAEKPEENVGHVTLPDSNDIYSGLGDLSNLAESSGGGFNSILYPNFWEDQTSAYLELNDLMTPLDGQAEVNGYEQASTANSYALSNSGGGQGLHGANFSGTSQPFSGPSQLCERNQVVNQHISQSHVFQMLNGVVDNGTWGQGVANGSYPRLPAEYEHAIQSYERGRFHS